MSRFSENLSPELNGIHLRAQRDKGWRFNNLMSLLTPEVLWRSYHSLRRDAAAGVDRVTWDDYGDDLRSHLDSLHTRLKERRYRAPSVRRTYIPKANGEQRPLGIPTLEDKIVQRAVADVLNAIFEADFLPVSYGYRPDIGAHDAHTDLGAEFQHGIYGYVVEADIRGFFDHIDHDWLLKMLEERIADRQFLILIRKWLKAGILEPDGMTINPVSGSPQGGIVSPILANIYLHYALDLWFVKVLKRQCRGRCFLMRYADDFVAGFQYQEDAQAFLSVLPERLAKFHLEVEPTKTGLHRFSRHTVDTGGSFDFLGFTFRWRKTRQGKPHVSRTTSRKRFHASVLSMKAWLMKARYWPRRILFPSLRRKVIGYAGYYGVPGNSPRLSAMYNQVFHLCHKWLNRCSQRKSYTMAGLAQALADYGITGMTLSARKPRVCKPFLWTCA